MDTADTAPISRFFDQRICCDGGPGDDVRPQGVSRRVLRALERIGLDGRTVLEIGAGAGALALAMLDRGAAKVTGVDLSPASVAQARQRAEQAGLAERAIFEVGDATGLLTERHDLVVLDKVVCCYPEAPSLLEAAAAAAEEAVVISLPPSAGPRGAMARLAIAAENAVRRLRRDAFRAYVHPEGQLHAAALSAGFRPAERRAGLIWDVIVYRQRA